MNSIETKTSSLLNYSPVRVDPENDTTRYVVEVFLTTAETCLKENTLPQNSSRRSFCSLTKMIQKTLLKPKTMPVSTPKDQKPDEAVNDRRDSPKPQTVQGESPNPKNPETDSPNRTNPKLMRSLSDLRMNSPINNRALFQRESTQRSCRDGTFHSPSKTQDPYKNGKTPLTRINDQKFPIFLQRYFPEHIIYGENHTVYIRTDELDELFQKFQKKDTSPLKKNSV